MKVTFEFDSGETRQFELMDESNELARGKLWQIQFCDPVNGDEVMHAGPAGG